MNTKRQIELFSAGCPLCQDTIELVQKLACNSCEISILDMNDSNVSKRATSLGVKTVPAVAINGQLADCCIEKGPNEESLKKAGVGQI